MYMRWGEENKFTLNVIEYTIGDEAGIKSATIKIEGEYAYGYMKGKEAYIDLLEFPL